MLQNSRWLEFPVLVCLGQGGLVLRRVWGCTLVARVVLLGLGLGGVVQGFLDFRYSGT